MADPISEALNNYAQGNVDLAKLQYLKRAQDTDEARRQANAMALLNAKMGGEKEIEQMRQAGELARTREQIEGYINKMSAAEKSKFKDYFRNLGLVQGAGESDEDFIKRGNMAVAGQANALWQSIQTNQAHANDLMTREQQRLAGVAAQRAKTQFAQDLVAQYPKLGKLLDSQPVENVLAQIKDPKDRASLAATWASYLQQAQDAAMKEFSPAIQSQVRQIGAATEQLAKAHGRILDNPSTAGAGPYLKFDVTSPQAPSFEDALKAAAAKASPPTSAPTPKPTAGISPSVLGPLADDSVFKAVQARNPHVLDSTSDPTAIIRGTAAMYDQDIAQAKQKLNRLGVQVGADGKPLVNPIENRIFPVSAGVGAPPVIARQPVRLSINEIKRRHDAATDIIKGLQDAQDAKSTLEAALSPSHANAVFFGPPAPSYAPADAQALLQGSDYPGQ